MKSRAVRRSKSFVEARVRLWGDGLLTRLGRLGVRWGVRRVEFFGEARPDLGELFDVFAGAFEGAAAVHVCGPVGRVDECVLRLLAQDLRHEGDEVLRDARVFEERLYDRVCEPRLF